MQMLVFVWLICIFPNIAWVDCWRPYEPKEGRYKKAWFAMGCFWGPDAEFPTIPGVIHTRVGYAGGTTKDPTYYDIGDHTEAIEIEYDADLMKFEWFLPDFWRMHDPTVKKNTQYESIIFYSSEKEKDLAVRSLNDEKKKRDYNIVTKVKPMEKFYLAENYHQKYRLRQCRDAFKLLDFTDQQVLDLYVAAKLNTFCSGIGSFEELKIDAKTWGLNNDELKSLKQCSDRVRDRNEL